MLDQTSMDVRYIITLAITVELEGVTDCGDEEVFVRAVVEAGMRMNSIILLSAIKIIILNIVWLSY